ncbi:respiratory nitrate reductase subunit gamma [Hydrogenophilus thiooxidans]|uniref:respiratory nitrate reductase subunit gamma n=1 Tax=Hydrogenophilus thiooxidans TaxID=2820326 RepID=UPI001C21E52C|nr:respiratory nitrate reductase subunit gamma [Hydrogenophilus thiooxidans]
MSGLFYLATLTFLIGMVWKILQYARTPAPLKIPTTPAPPTSAGVVARLARETLFFESLFRANLLLWFFAVLFHGGLALVFIRHLRYFVDPVPAWLVWMQPFGIYGGIAMVLGLMGLLARRFLIRRVRYISTPSDYLWLVLLLVIGVSGLTMTYVAHPDVVALKAYIQSLWHFTPAPFPADPFLTLHLLGFLVLLALFPFSKLLHAPGVFFSPTRNQADDAREHRHLAPWSQSELESQ